MAKTKFIDAAGREAYVDDAGMVYTEGGNNPTYYNKDAWNQRQTKKYGSGGTAPTESVTSIFDTGNKIDLNKIYSDTMGSKDIKNTQAEIDKVMQEITAKETAMNNQLEIVNDNPWYSEGTRVGREAKVKEAAQNDINTSIRKQEMLAAKLNNLKADAETSMNIKLKQYDINNQEYANNLQKFNMLLTSGALSSISPTDVAAITRATGLTSTMIQNIQNKMRADAVKPQLIQNEDANGNVTISVVDVNTGKVISQQSLGTVGKGSGGNGNASKADINAVSQKLQALSGQDGYVSPTDFSNIAKLWGQAGYNSEDFYNQFRQYVNPSHWTDYGIPAKYISSASVDPMTVLVQQATQPKKK